MKVQIVVPDSYNGLDQRPRACPEGSILETTVEYGQALIAAGLATWPGAEVEPEPVPEPVEPEPPAQEPEPKPVARRKRK
jgi:hypothetical protein